MPADKTAPVKLIALSGKPFETKFWGKCVQDLNGLKMSKPRIAIDLEHDKPIGYINRFAVVDNTLELSGAITPVTEEAKDTLALMQAGVPFESSIDFTPSHSEDLIIEEYEDGFVVVNGQTIEAPVTVFRQWVLRAVAICKSGADNQTSATLQKADESELINITINQPDNTDHTPANNMTVDNNKSETIDEAVKVETPVETPVSQNVETPVDKAVETQTETTVEATEQKILPVETTTPAIVEDGLKADNKEDEKPHEIFKQYLQTFGNDKATEYFAQGLSLLDAKDKHYGFLQSQYVANTETIKNLNNEIEQLKGRLEKKSFKPVEFEQSVNVTLDLWQQYQQIKDPVEKTMFYRLHKKEMNK